MGTTMMLQRDEHKRMSAPQLGWFKQRKWTSYDTDLEAVTGERLVLSRTNWHRTFVAKDTSDIPVGEFQAASWRTGRGPLTWHTVEYEFGTQNAWRSTFTLTRYGAEFARFQMKGLGHTVEVTVADGAEVPHALLLFCAWVTLRTIQDRTSAAAT